MLALRALKRHTNQCKENQRSTALGVGEARVGRDRWLLHGFARIWSVSSCDHGSISDEIISEIQVTQRSSWSLSSRGLGMLPGNCFISVPSRRVVNSVKDHEIPLWKSGTNCSYGLQTNHDRIWQQPRVGNWLECYYIYIYIFSLELNNTAKQSDQLYPIPYTN